MKYIVKRASDWESMPVRDCKYEVVHELTKTRDKNHETNAWLYRCCTDVHEEGELLVGTDKQPTKVWTLDIDDIHSFVEKYGQIVLSKPDNSEGLWNIIIYDSYLE